MVLNHTIKEANACHRNNRGHGQQMSYAVIELFHGLYGMLKPHVVHINIIQFRQKELYYYVALLNTR